MNDKLKYVQKSWGFEKWLENNNKYCGKELVCTRGNWSSKGKFHFHEIKDETFYIIEGTLLLITREHNEEIINVLKPGDTFRIKPGLHHKFTALDNDGCRFIEFSTTHYDSDSYRVD